MAVNKISSGSGKFLFVCIFMVFYRATVYPQNPQAYDSYFKPEAFSAGEYYGEHTDVKNSVSFYKRDSIFSLHSMKGFAPSLLHDLDDQATSPLKFRTKEWLVTGAAIGITAALIHYDDEIDHLVRNQKQDHVWVNKFSPVITQLGGDYGYYTVAAAGLISAAFKNEKGVETSLLAAKAMLTSGIWVQLIKHITSRERPKAAYIFSGSDGGKWYGPMAEYNHKISFNKSVCAFDAFPSGHTATAFSIASVVAMQYRDIKAVPIVSYSVASLVGISRLTEHEHWASDVFVGALLGYLCGKQVVDQYYESYNKKYHKGSSRLKIQREITLNQNGNQVGLYVRF